MSKGKGQYEGGRAVRDGELCEPISEYCRVARKKELVLDLFPSKKEAVGKDDIRVIELFAGVGGFRVGLERSSKRFRTVWNNQWEPSTKRQDASICYCSVFGADGHSNEDIATVPVEDIPEADLLCGGFPCQDYSVATTLKNAKGLEGKKGVLWWQIHRILRDMPEPPKYLFLENVDRIIGSPAVQRGRDFAIILASLSDLGYCVEWRIVNAADYGMPQRRRRTYIVAYKANVKLGLELSACADKADWVLKRGVMARAFSCAPSLKKPGTSAFAIEGDLAEITKGFNAGRTAKSTSPFKGAGVMQERKVWSMDVEPVYDGPRLTLADILVDEREVPEEYFLNQDDIDKWKYLKGCKHEKRTSSDGYEYNYSEGSMPFPDPTDRPSRTIITGEGGEGASRFKHVVETPSGRLRRLVPVELERLNMFPDNHTGRAGDARRAFLMGNALVTGVIERVGTILTQYI